MRLAMVSEHASPLAALGGVDAGGQNVHVAALSAALARHGVTTVVHTRRDAGELARRVPIGAGVEVDHVDAGPAHPLPKDELLPHMSAFARQLGEQWRHETPDVVHSHFWMSGMAALRAARPLGIPVVHTFHALGVVKRRHQGAQDTSPPQRSAVEGMIVGGADHIVATCSDEVFELIRLGADPSRLTIVPCGVDLDLFRPEGPRCRPPAVRYRLAVVGRLVERKGIQDVIGALAQLPDTELVVAGGPPREELARDPDAARLTAHARALGVADRVRLIGRTDHADMPALIRSADAVVCVPWYEPFGIVPLEAMACGVPVVASNVGGMIDTVVDGVTGLHVPARDPDALAARLRRLLDDTALRRRLGSAGAKRARARYSWDRVAQSTLGVYEAVISQRRAATHSGGAVQSVGAGRSGVAGTAGGAPTRFVGRAR